MLDDFMYHGHPCLTFPILGKSTYDFQKDNDYRPFKFDQVKKMSFQLFFVSFDAVTVGKVKNGFYSRIILQNRF